MDKTKTAVVAVLIFASAAFVGYAYITGMGPLEENPAAGLEEPPETENTYEFGDVPQNGNEANVDAERQDDEEDSEDDSESDDGDENANGQSEDVTDGGSDDATEEDTDAQLQEAADTETNAENDGMDDDSGGQDGDETDDRTYEEPEDESVGDGGGDSQNGENEDGDTGGYDDVSQGTRTVVASTGTSGKPFDAEIEEMTKCGETCREATVALHNRMDVDAEDIVVYVRLYAGDSTDPDDVVWADNRELGTLGAGEVYRTTDSVDLTPQQANNVREEDGLVTAKATVESRQAIATFVGKDNVK